LARLKVGVLISGRGSNLAALLDACRAPGFPAEIALAISNNATALGLELASKAGVPTVVIDHRKKSRADFETEIDRALRGAGIELICLAGFMRLLTPGFVEAWADRLINIHPSLLPAYRGVDVAARALADGVRFSGCTVHYVRAETDDGPIIIQAAVPVLPNDTAETLSARILLAEHRIYPLALRWIAEGRVRVHGRQVEIAGATAPEAPTFNPQPTISISEKK
jgi:phosphoribosylglycinamide formyltransferase-1